jgi:hypothetical protein
MKGCESNRVDRLNLEVAFVVACHQIVLMHEVGDEAAFTRKCLPDRLAGFVESVRFDCFVYCLCFDNNLLLWGRRFMVTELAK